ncbi:hypothetical protein UFOVP507_48 [uncultured Caudovirales phage]|uniref:Uncharacterized protein n=1 Tax=uncultured Caudovirales phage TaxID=2100421 RepID=A0A6J5MS48_9CAUD|nr:hypothetical protein UFOVP507_48 [uncultured Caudovirales phage]
MAYNYLQLVNEVLVRLREREVTSISDNTYSKLVSKYVNDAKRQSEDAYNWNALSVTLTADTTPNLFNYVLEGSGQRFRVIDIISDTSDIILKNETTQKMNQLFLTQTAETGEPRYYNFNGTDSAGDTQVDLYPIPDAVYNIRFNIIRPQPPLSSNTDVLLIPHEPVIFGAVARALAERGEDGGVTSSESYALYLTSLADAIALESGRYIEEAAWIDI